MGGKRISLKAYANKLENIEVNKFLEWVIVFLKLKIRTI